MKGRFSGVMVEILFISAVILYVVCQHTILADATLRHQEMLYTDGQAASAKVGNRVYLEHDSYTWLTYAKEMLQTGAWRINYTFSDNPPFGREAHWSSLLCWILVAAGWLRRMATGEPIFTALENAAFFINLSQLLLAMVVWYALMRKLLGRGFTLVGLFLLALLPSIAWAFHPGRPDHQTLHFLAALGSVGLLICGGLGWTRSTMNSGQDSFLEVPEKKRALACFRLAGVMGALGIWVGATVQLTVLFFAGCSVVGLIFFVSQKEIEEAGKRGLSYMSEVWWIWGKWGAAFTILFYLLQYFPFDMRMRLETIHPLYAVSWAGAGWLLMRCCQWRISGSRWLLRDWRLWLALGAFLAWPVASQFGPSEWHILRDQLVVRFQTHTTEGRSFPLLMGRDWLSAGFQEVGLLPLFLLAMPLFAGNSKYNRHEWMVLFFVWITGTGYFILAYWQVRWLSFAGLAFVILIPVFLKSLSRLYRGMELYVAWAVFGLVLVASGGLFLWNSQLALSRTVRDIMLHPTIPDMISTKRLARSLRAGMPDEEIRVIADPGAAPALYYFNGIKSVGSLFWQNSGGLRDTRDFFIATNDYEAEVIATARGVSYILVGSKSDDVMFQLYLKYGKSFNQAQGDFLIVRLIDGVRTPAWAKEDFVLSAKVSAPFKMRIPGPVPRLSVYRTDFR